MKEVAEAEGYQFIFEQGVLLYADESNDITEKVKAKVK
ncbi:MAG: OmpH family outer membrane protein [Bacteroidota bacterium]